MASALINIKIHRHAKEDTIFHCLYGYFFLGIKKSQLAKIYCKNVSTISNWIEKFEKNGAVGRQNNVKNLYRKFNYEKRQWLVSLYKEKPILYQREAAQLFFDHFHTNISVSSISAILHSEGLTWKCLERRAIQLQSNDIIRYYQELASIDWLLHQVVFLDEVSFDNQDMLRRKGYGTKGQSLLYRGEFCRKARISLLCFLGIDGIVDCYSTEGTFDRFKFFQFCQKFALDHCKKYPGRNSVWILDGAKIHTDKAIVMYLRSLGIIPIFLPAYAPFYNPIEIIFGLIKRFLREIYNENSKESVEYCVALAMKHFSRMNCKDLYKKCGYVGDGFFDPSIGLAQKLEDFGFH